ncbi:MAG: DNA topoisomerase VI subunit B [Deltaproteobacteria bacterium]|nr:DNA topoisomerase VI subunit B [Deltaproteobacteria bacterium]
MSEQSNLAYAGLSAAARGRSAAGVGAKPPRGAKSGSGRKGRTPRPPKPRERATASDLARKQRDISVSEFFAKNRHLLGFDNPAKALLTTVKEGVDNALDACEEAGIAPDVRVEILQKSESRFRVAIQDNGPGIVKSQVPKIFGRLLYGSKFHRLRQSRGQQGIGISAAGMFGLLTTGKPVKIVTRTGRGKPAQCFELVIDTRSNEPKVRRDEIVKWDPPHGTRVEIELEGSYRGGQHSVDAYIRQIALANPHAQIDYLPPAPQSKAPQGKAPQGKAGKTGKAAAQKAQAPEAQGLRRFPRVTKELPPETAEISPHPYGVELGVLMQMFRDTRSRNLRGCLQADFSRVSGRLADEICERAGVRSNRKPAEVSRNEAERIHHAIQQTKIMAPPTDCIAPIGEALLEKALRKEVQADFYATLTRRPAVYRGNPFLIEVGLAYGGALPAEEPISVYRFANRVPLQYQQGACAITKAVSGTDWKSYQLQQPRGALPVGPMVLMLHIASVWVPFTSESKEAIAHYPEIVKEMRLGLQECGRRVAIHIRRRRREADEAKKRAYIEQYIPQVAVGLQEILGFANKERDSVVTKLTDVLKRSRKL